MERTNENGDSQSIDQLTRALENMNPRRWCRKKWHRAIHKQQTLNKMNETLDDEEESKDIDSGRATSLNSSMDESPRKSLEQPRNRFLVINRLKLSSTVHPGSPKEIKSPVKEKSRSMASVDTIKEEDCSSCCQWDTDSKSSEQSARRINVSTGRGRRANFFKIPETKPVIHNSVEDDWFDDLPDLQSLKHTDYFAKKCAEWNEKNVPACLVDSHCHFPMLFARIGMDPYERSEDSQTSMVEEYMTNYKHFYVDQFEACVNVLCDPKSFHTKYKLFKMLKLYEHSKVYFTIGCHPHFSNWWSEQSESIAKFCFEMKKANDPLFQKLVAVGECGLDWSNKNSTNKEEQENVFVKQIKLARDFSSPLVIHCRDAERRVLELLKEHCLPDQSIHLHCFTGGWELAQEYLDHFENLCIGVTPLCSGANKMNDMLRNIPMDRLLLETDSPYFVPRYAPNFPKHLNESHPAFVYATAESVADVRGIDLDVVVSTTRKNVKKVYGF